MTALAVFICRANSHPFEERQVSLNEPVKIGRSVTLNRPAQTNAIFECMVLSRNHALLWYDNGKFFLQDTKSSNGTFINNQRLSKGLEESQPRVLSSGDIVQFGVAVLDRTHRVIHGCIIASVKLYHADGKEAANNNSSLILKSPATGATLQPQEIYQIAQCLQEALHREKMLENKLAKLQWLVDNTQSAAESGWQALINEDRLLSRLEITENQLQAYSKNQTEESLQQKVVELHEDKDIYEFKSKEALRKVLDEKLDAVQKLTDLERSVSTTEDECAHMREMCKASQTELADLAKKHQDAVAEVNALTLKLQEAEKERVTDLERVEKEKLELEARIEEMSKEEEGLHANVEALEAAADFSRIQLANMEQKLEEKVASSPNSVNPQLTESQSVQVELISLLDLQLLQSKNGAGDGSCDNSTTDEEDNKAKEELLAKENDGNEIEKEAEDDESISEAELTATLSNLEDMATLKLSNNIDDDLSTLENTLIRPPEKLKASQKQLEQYKAQLEESEKKLKDSQDKAQLLQKELDEARVEVNKHLSRISSLEERLKQSDGQLSEMVEKAVVEFKKQLQELQKQCSNTELLNEKLSEKIESLEVDLIGLKSEVSSEEIIPTFSEVQGSSISETALKEEVESLKDLLEEVEKSRKQFEDENTAHKCELSKTHEELQMSSTELSELKEQLEASRLLTSEKATMVAQLTERLQEIESNQVDVKTQLANLQDEKTKAVTESRQAKLQIDNLKATVCELESELHLSNRYGNEADTDASKAHQEMQKHQASNKAEFANLKQECSDLKKRIQDIETEMKMSRIENNQLKTDYTNLEQSYRELEELKETLEDEKQTWELNMTDAQKSANATKSELLHANDEIAQLKMEVLGYKDEISQLEDEFIMMNEKYDNLSYKCKTVYTYSMIPLLVLLLGILIAFFPVLSVFTVTSQPDFPQTQSLKL